jgi:Transient receptor potential (TRP) ion channel/ML-like domain
VVQEQADFDSPPPQQHHNELHSTHIRICPPTDMMEEGFQKDLSGGSKAAAVWRRGWIRGQPRRHSLSTSLRFSYGSSLILLLGLFALFMPIAEAAFINFDNCLNPNILNSKNPQQIQFVPLFLDARFNASDPKHSLNITVYGNVTGQATVGDYPPPNDPSWGNATDPFGKIVDSTINYTTLFATYNVLTYTPYDAPPLEFCNLTVNPKTGSAGTCPWGPLFTANSSDPSQLHAFTVGHDFFSTYSFATLVPTIKIRAGDSAAQFLGCVSASVTPDLGSNLSAALRYVPAAILALVGIATISAARLSPWSSSDFFYWTSNYGRDDDILRLITPGFGDCLQYIQFIVLAGSLGLSYPGYYQPAVSQASWSILMFNESFVSHGNGTQSLVDGIYQTNGSYGLTTMSQLAGMTSVEDVWAGMTIWLCVIIGMVILLCQLGFAVSWFVRQMYETPQEDLRSKNLPFTGGNVVRIVFSYFLLPIISLSMFQLVIAQSSTALVVALAVVGLVAIICIAAWIFRLIFTTRPREHLFDHLPLLLLYGPLYNTYSDEAAPFAFIPVLLTFIRGIAIGAIQPSGIAQLVILAICEVILILTLHAFRPFQSLTSMNAYHTFFAIVKLITILLSIAFIPTLGVAESSKGWIGYAILLLHAIVLVFGFFLNAIQTLIEVFARAVGGRDDRGGITKVFGVRQLSKRARHNVDRGSMASDAAMLTRASEAKRSRSISASSAMMLNAAGLDQRASGNFDQVSQGGGSQFSTNRSGPSTPGGPHSPFTFVGGQAKRPTVISKATEPPDPYYRAPRQRRPTLDPLTGRSASLGSEGDMADLGVQQLPQVDAGEGPSGFSPNRGSNIGAAHFRHFRDDSESNLSDRDRRNTTDYATRESDFYYGLRGPALSSMPSRRRKTGPADPMSPVASAKGWFTSFFAGGKRKDKSKGFEVVRSTPLHLIPMEEEEEVGQHEPYHDSPLRGGVPQATAGAERDSSPEAAIQTPESDDEEYHDAEDLPNHGKLRSEAPPTLGPIESGSLHMPSRIGSQRSEQPAELAALDDIPVPRKSSKRRSYTGDHPMPPIAAYPHARQQSFSQSSHLKPGETRVPFGTGPSPSPERAADNSRTSSIYPASEEALELLSRDEGAGRTYRTSAGPEQSFQVNAPYASNERPVSTGHVVHHLASDSIHPGYYESGAYSGSQAELVEDQPLRR